MTWAEEMAQQFGADAKYWMEHVPYDDFDIQFGEACDYAYEKARLASHFGRIALGERLGHQIIDLSRSAEP